MKKFTDDVLLVDENNREKDVIQRTLSHMGLNVMIPRNPVEALRIMDKSVFKLVLIDTFEDPSVSLDLVRKIRDKFDTPIIMLLDKQKDLTEDKCFKAGIDDYVTKPINDQILNLRVNQQISNIRSESLESALILNWNELSLDSETCDFMINGKYVPLTRTEFFLLRCLLSNPERVFTRPQLLNAMNVTDGIGSDHLIDTHLSRLRVKIRENGGGDYIRAIRGIGIKFSVPNYETQRVVSGISKNYQYKEV
ncbi:MAG: response regulator transcription factor [Actinomycetales bacterium]|nr:response regulator transcription factor [Actinomycetales bacterium]